MFSKKMIVSSLLLVMTTCGLCFAEEPAYQTIPADAGQIIASGIADAVGTGGTAFVEYWAWDGGNGYYYYTYRINNTAFNPYIKYLTIANPSGEPYIITGISSGWNPITNTPGVTPWSTSVHMTMPTLVEWASTDPYSHVYPGYSSWGQENGQLFQFVSTLPPSSAGFTVRQGDLMIYAAGLIASPGSTSMRPRSAGYWKHQFGNKGKRLEAPSLPDYLNVINANSSVFNGLTLSSALDILMPEDNSIMIDKAKKQLMALWLNIVSGKLNYSASIQVDGPTGEPIEVVISQSLNDIESTILNSASTLQELEYAKDMAEILNLL